MFGIGEERPRRGTGDGLERAERGLTLVELAVVVAVLAILVGLAAIGVTGAGTRARATTKVKDIREVQQAVNAYRGLHPQEKWPTARKQVGQVAIETGNLPIVPFAAGDPASFVAIDWSSTFTTTLDGARSLVPNFLRTSPKHGLATTMDTDGDGAPEQPVATPVWVLDRHGVVNVLLSDGDY